MSTVNPGGGAPTPTPTPAPTPTPTPAPAPTPTPTPAPEGGAPTPTPDPAAGGPPKPGEGAAGGDPQPYAAFNLPEGYQIPEGIATEFKTFAQANKLTQEQAQGAVDLFVKARQDADAAFNRMVEVDWKKQAQEHPEIGGANFDANVAAAREGMMRTARPELVELLDTWGLGNHWAVIAHFADVQKRIKGDAFHGAAGRPEGQGAPTQPTGIAGVQSGSLYTKVDSPQPQG
jgi:hypothetical protein